MYITQRSDPGHEDGVMTGCDSVLLLFGVNVTLFIHSLDKHEVEGLLKLYEFVLSGHGEM